MTSPGDLGGSTARGIGRYFEVSTFVPTFVVVSYVHALTLAAPWMGSPGWGRAFESVMSVEFLGLTSVIALAVGMLLHPLQLVMTQTLEGYWGVAPFARRLRVAFTRVQRERRKRLHELRGAAHKELVPTPEAPLPKNVLERMVPAVVAHEEASRALELYPDGNAAVMPTRLGNILRTVEWQAGRQYGLPVIEVAPHLTLVAPPEHVAWIDDRRTTFDRSVRLTWLTGAAAVLSVAMLWRSGFWLLLAALPYLAALGCYRGALTLAAEYSNAVAIVLDVNRFTLYERLGVPRPADTATEREQNSRLLALLRRQHVDLTYDEKQTR